MHARADMLAAITTSCPSKETAKVAPIVGVLATELVAIAVDAVGASLASAAETKSVSRAIQTQELPFYQFAKDGDVNINPRFGCIVVFDAALGRRPTPIPAPAPDKKSSTVPPRVPGWFSNIQKSTAFSDAVTPAGVPPLTLTSLPRFYFEASIDPQLGMDRFKLTPRVLYVGDFQESEFYSKATRAYAISLNFTDASSLVTFDSTNILFENIGRQSNLINPEYWQQEGNSLELKMPPSWPEARFIRTFPRTLDVIDHQRAIQHKVEPYLFANAAFRNHLSPVLPPRKMAEDEAALDLSLKELCTAIQETNADRPKSVPWIVDDRCPVHLFRARQDFQRERKKVQAQLDREWAKEFATFVNKKGKICDDVSLPDNGGVVTQCALPALDHSLRVGGSLVIKVSVVETRDPLSFVRTLASAFSNNSDTIKATIDQRVNPVKREQATVASEAAVRNAANTYEVSRLKAQALEAKLAESSDKPESERLEIQIELTIAKIQANKDARAAGVPPPYPGL